MHQENPESIKNTWKNRARRGKDEATTKTGAHRNRGRAKPVVPGEKTVAEGGGGGGGGGGKLKTNIVKRTSDGSRRQRRSSPGQAVSGGGAALKKQLG